MFIIAAFAQAPSLIIFANFGAMLTTRFLVPLALLQAAFMCGIGMLVCQVEVTKDRLTLNWVNVLPWDQIERVAPSNVLGLRYVKAYRKGRRWAWWFPLYLADEDGFRRAVIERAPARNPFRMFFETEASPKA
jgi:hypothetical protein